MANPINGTLSPWGGGPSAKTKTVVQRSVTALLDELAPHPLPKNVKESERAIEQYRVPSGCVLQAANCAVTISWFAEPTQESALGELHIRVWQGTVTRRGGHRAPHHAVMLSELVLRPVEAPVDNCMWGATDGTLYDSAALAAKCSELLGAQILASP